MHFDRNTRPYRPFEASRLAFQIILALGSSGLISNAALAQTAPTMTPAGGTFTTEQEVFISTPDTNVTLRYTVDGTAPTTNSTFVPDNQQVLISQPTTVKAAGFNGATRGTITTNTFTITGQVSCGGQHCVVLKSDGTLWTAGINSAGQLGNGNFNIFNTNNPIQIANLSGFTSIASGYYHSVALNGDGTVWAWGDNSSGELGIYYSDSFYPASSYPVQVTSLSGITAIAAGEYDSLALRNDGTVWAWGLNSSGQLGNGSTNSTSFTPVQVTGLTNIVAISAGDYHCLALDANGYVWGWGNNADGELGLGTTNTQYLTPQKMTNLTSITAIAGGGYHSLFVRNDGTVWGTGQNIFYELSSSVSNANSTVPMQVGGISGVVQVSAGDYFSAALKTNGTIWTWGQNSDNSLGINSSASYKALPVQVTNIPAAIAISCEADHGLALRTNGVIYGWGDNSWGELGIGTANSSQAPAVSQFIGYTLNQTPPTPTGLIINYTTPTQATLSWSQAGNVVQSFTVQLSTNNGSTWTTTNTVDASQNSEVLNGLNAASNYKFRIIANGTYSSSTASSNAAELVTNTITGTNVAPATLTNTITIGSGAGTVTRVDFYEGNTYLGSNSNSPYTMVLSNVMAGPHTYTAIVNNTNGEIGLGQAVVTVNMPYDPMAAYRFVRGPGTNPLYQSYVMSIDELTGVGLNQTNNNSQIFTNGLPWFVSLASPTLYQLALSNTNLVYSTQFQNPMAAFGAAGGGTPLYTGQSYHFAFGSGGQLNSNTYADLQINIYAKSQFGYGVTNVFPYAVATVEIPHQGTPQWSTFAQNGYTTNIDLTPYGCPLITTIQYDPGAQIVDQYDQLISTPFVITHKSTSSDYYYEINYEGISYDSNGDAIPMSVSNPANALSTTSYGYGYTLDFTDRPAWISTSLSMPSFNGIPMPPEYAGASIEELLNVSSTVNYQFTNDPSKYLTNDDSPELRTNPVLDKFISDMGSNPIVLANYILNEIHLSDAISYNESGSVSTNSINVGGVNRSALATFLEKEGSPTEQCALLIYFLRKCGMPCAYVFPTPNTLQMLDARMSTLLRLQLNGDAPVAGTGPQILSVNYPWVAAYDSNSSKWVHIFPWLKDTSITQGYDINDYLPSGYNTGYGWLQHYLYRDPNILSLSTQYDNPGILYPLYVSEQLALSGLTTNDIGVTIFDRSHNYQSWGDFPQPWSVTSNSLGSANLVESLSSFTNSQLGFTTNNIFNTFQCQIFSTSRNTTNPILDTHVMRMVDLHNRKITLLTSGTNTNSMTLQLSLDALRPGTTNIEAFPVNGTNIVEQLISTNITSSDDALDFRTIYNRNLPLGSGFNTTNTNSIFLGTVDTQQVEGDRPMRVGDAAVLCLDYGRVTQDMVNVHAQNYWNAQQVYQENTNVSMDNITAIGTPLYIAGMTYYKRITDFAETLQALHDISDVSFFASGFSKMSPLRNAQGQLTNGPITLIEPNVDMSFIQMGYVGNSTIDPADGTTFQDVCDDWFTIFMGEVSAQEHVIINTFYGVTDSASTVHLLSDAQTNGGSIVALNSTNYIAAGSSNYTYNGTNQSLSAWAGTNMWSSITNALNNTQANDTTFTLVYVTPGPVLCASNTYLGMGAFIIAPTYDTALISGNMTYPTNPPLNGGWGPELDTPISVAASPQFNLSFDQSGDSSFQTVPQTTTHPGLDNGNNDVFSEGTTELTGLISGTLLPTQDQTAIVSAVDNLSSSSGGTLSFVNSAAAIQAVDNSGLVGTETVYQGNSHGGSSSSLIQTVSDPVNVVRGDFYVNDTDLVIPGPMPIQFSRNYDSQNIVKNEFGYGWRTGYFAYLGTITNSPLIYAAEMDGSVLAYRLKTGSTTTWVPLPSDNPTLCNQHGDSTGSVFNLFNNNIVVSGTGTNAIYTLNGADGSKRTFAIQSYPLAGTNNITRQRPYLQSWVDPQGNQLTFSFGTNSLQPDYGFLNRISASNGNFLQLDYDTYGHIISANAADGRRLSYGYDSYGDLINVTRPDGSVIGYTYQHLANTGTNATGYYSTHLLTQVNKPEGWTLVNGYDGTGRVTNQQSTVGTGGALARTGTFSYNSSTNTDGTLSGTTQLTDAYNHVTTYTYAEGQITQILDPLSQTIQTTWYTNSNGSGAYQRSLASRTDKRGLNTTYSYDGNGNLTNSTTTGNITGTGSSSAVKATTYNSLNLPTQITEPNGNYEVLTYGSSISPYLVTKDQKYASGGGLISETDTTYTSTGGTNVPYANGLVQTVTQGVGAAVPSTISYTYNNNGYPASETHPTGTADPTVSYTMTYNLRGQLIKKVDSAGQWTGYAYDDLGNLIWEERHDSNNNLVSWNYKYFNENGQISWTQGCRYDPCDYTETIYDDAGRVSQTLVWNNQATSSGVTGGTVATTTYTHDLFGNLIQVIDPIGTVTTMGYDAIGQMTNAVKVDASGHTLSSETFTREPGGNVATHVDVLGGNTTTTYTQTGQPESKSNPDGTSQLWQYQIDSRLSQETLPNGSTRNISYNDASRTVTMSLKDSGGNALSTEVQVYDALGNIVSKTDGEGYTFTASYDGLSRPKTETGPTATGSGQQTITHSYDAAGLSRTDLNGLGETTITSFDAISRPLEVDIYGATGTLVRSTGYQYSPDHQAVSVTEGKPSGSFTPSAVTTYTDVHGNPVLVIKPDGGTVTSVYDANENLVSKTDELGHRTSYTYDGLNHLIQEVLPDNGTISFGNDAAGNLTNRAMPAGLTWSAIFNSASQKTSEQLAQGTGVTRTNSFTYNTSGNGAGQIATMTDPRGIVTTYMYDGFGRATNVAAADPTFGVTRTYTYDRRNLLKEVDQSYQNSSTGLPTKVIRTLDGYGAIASEQTYINGTLKDNLQQSHDAAGRRIALNGLTYPYGFGYDADGNVVRSGFKSNIYQGVAYTYNTDGRLSSRITPWIVQNIKRDSVGRMTNSVYTGTGLNGDNTSGEVYLNEKISWFANSTENTDIITRGGATNVTDNRSYSYDSRGHLSNENFNPSPGLSGSATYQFDGNTTGGLGLRTSVTLGVGLSGQNNASYGNFARLTNETVTGALTNNLGALSSPVTQSYDAAGNVTNRTWGSVSDTLTWDAFGQLVGDTRSGSANNFTWSAVYDGLGRRLQTTQGSLVIQSSYDPEVEFLELTVTAIQGSVTNTYVKTYGPDLSGHYGGMQGTGGLDEIQGCPVMSDSCGNNIGLWGGEPMTVSSSISDGYGALPGGGTPVTVSTNYSPGSILAWRGHYIDPTGYYYLGTRYYAPDSGTFLSPDPLGHAATMDLYQAFGGDPINIFDPDGRVGVNSTLDSADSGTGATSVAGVNQEQLSQPSLFSATGILQQSEMLSIQAADNKSAADGPIYAGPGDTLPQTTAQQVSTTLSAIPGVGQALQGFEAISGYNPITGSYLSDNQQYAAAGGTLLTAALPFISLESSAAEGPLQAGELTTYASADARAVIGDGLEAHELWQHANLNEMGLATTRLSTPASQMNPVIILDEDTHAAVTAAQGALDARAMTPVQNITANAQILRDLNAAPPEVIDAAEQAALRHAGNYGY